MLLFSKQLLFRIIIRIFIVETQQEESGTEIETETHRETINLFKKIKIILSNILKHSN